MQSTFFKGDTKGFDVSFKGKYCTAGFPALVENGGIRTVGGFLSTSNTEGSTTMKSVDGNAVAINTPIFGVPLFAKAASPAEMFVGNGGIAANLIGSSTAEGAAAAANMVFRGFLLNRAMINHVMPGHSDRIIPNQPCDAVYQGAVWLFVQAYTSSTVAIGDDILVCKTGEIFAKSSNKAAASQDYFAVPNSKIIEKHSEIDGLYLVMLS